MEIKKELKEALRAVEDAMNAIGGELGKGGNLPWAYTQLQTAQQKIKRALQNQG